MLNDKSYSSIKFNLSLYITPTIKITSKFNFNIYIRKSDFISVRANTTLLR